MLPPGTIYGLSAGMFVVFLCGFSYHTTDLSAVLILHGLPIVNQDLLDRQFRAGRLLRPQKFAFVTA